MAFSPKSSESGTDRPSFIKKRKSNGLIYLSKVDFLKMFLLDSQWWTDASLFVNENGPFNFTLEERKQMIELMNIQRLLEDARSGSDTEEESKGSTKNK